MYATPPRQTRFVPASCPAGEASTSSWPLRTSSRPHSQPAPMVRLPPQSPPTPTKRSFSRSSRPILPPRQHSGSLVAQIAMQNLSLHAWEVNPFEQSFVASSPPPPEDTPKRWASLVGLQGVVDPPSSPPPVPAPPVAVNLFGYESMGEEAEQFTWQGQGQSQASTMLAPPELQSKWSVSSYGAGSDTDEAHSDHDNDSEAEDELDAITDYYFSRSYSKTDSESSGGSSFFGRRRSSPFGLEPPSATADSPVSAQDEWRPCGAPFREVDNTAAAEGERVEVLRTQVGLLRKRTRSDTASAPIQPKRSMEWVVQA